MGGGTEELPLPVVGEFMPNNNSSDHGEVEECGGDAENGASFVVPFEGSFHGVCSG